MKTLKRAPKLSPRRYWLGAVALLGFSMEMAAPDKAPDNMTEKVQRALKRIIDESAESDPDAGATDEPPSGVRAYTPSPEPETITADGGLPEYRRLPAPDKKGGSGKKVIILQIHEIIDMGLSALVARAISSNLDAAALILDINTPGGRVDAATEIRDAIMAAPKSMRTVAFIHPRAISAGAFISLACDLIFIADGGSIGAATPITLGESGEAQPVGEKMVSYFRTEMAATARAKGRRGDIAEAMVDYEVEIKGLTPAGKLLTLDTAGALKWKMADAKANTLEDVLELLALGDANQTEVKLNWAEKLARIFTHPILSGILMSIGVLGILIELYQPGFGLPGAVGITCLVIFFAGHMVVDLAGWEEVLIFIVGASLLAVEIFVTPGFGVLGAAGVLAILVSLVLSINAMPLDVSLSTGSLGNAMIRVFLSLGISVLLFFVAFAYLPRTRIGGKLVLDAAIKATSSGGREGETIKQVVASGQSGVAESFLRPAGIARFGDARVDVMTEGDFVERGEQIVIVRVTGNRVIVRKKEA